jgi:hypothetical protein
VATHKEEIKPLLIGEDRELFPWLIRLDSPNVQAHDCPNLISLEMLSLDEKVHNKMYPEMLSAIIYIERRINGR